MGKSFRDTKTTDLAKCYNKPELPVLENMIGQNVFFADRKSGKREGRKETKEKYGSKIMEHTKRSTDLIRLR